MEHSTTQLRCRLLDVTHSTLLKKLVLKLLGRTLYTLSDSAVAAIALCHYYVSVQHTLAATCCTRLVQQVGL